MKKVLLLLLALLSCPRALAQPASADAGEYPFRVEQSQSRKGIQITAVNDGPAVVTVFIKVSGDNFQSDKILPLAAVVEPKSSQPLALLSPLKRWEPIRFRYSHFHNIGDAFTPPDKDHPYRLPFAKGVQAQVSQAPDGVPVTHTETYNRHAIDFAMPTGTAIAAARAGVVIAVKDEFTEGRPDPALADKANFVAIMHSDHTIAHYVHLAPRKALVRPGQKVRAGEVIAHSGNTGYSYGPHLHFDVRRAAVRPGGEVVQESVPVDFRRPGTNKKITIKEGARVAAD
ncbi:MAG: M23 family metallopeptidase [Azoarcus sp.]|jgi:murein DD-endopeptidase MepM/ murein hydrolase activator NlpD|nr:M23 family metallopeptidase [Azoarcus sp.]